MNNFDSISDSKNARNLELVCRISSCTRCELHTTRNKTVPGEGPIDSTIMIIGEGPGEENDKTGRPFVGKGGSILDKHLALAEIKREQLFLTNIIKCRMPHNTTPSAIVVNQCMDYLQEQISIINPKIIIALGLPAAKLLLNNKKLRLADLHNQLFHKDTYTILCTYHPSSIRYNKDASQRIVETLLKAKELSEF